MRFSAEVDLVHIADDTHGYAGADLSQLVTEAAMQCVRERAGDIDEIGERVGARLALAGLVPGAAHVVAAADMGDGKDISTI
jgi:SpoVK/Ycf46/Vps4 family AAA+-type ATPase